MFSDSQIVEKFACNGNKLYYSSTFGLAPYYKDNLMNQLKDVSFYSVSFHESHNRFTKNEQMDLNI